MDKGKKEAVEIEIGSLIILGALVLLWPAFVGAVKASPYFNHLGTFLDAFVIGLKWILGFLTGLSIPVSIFFVIVIIYSVEQLKRIRDKEKLIYDTKTEEAYETNVPESADIALARRWDTVTAHIASKNPNDWKQAIIDADIMLDDILTRLGYQGDSVGEKLKRVNEGDMKHRQEAWDAHMVRNRIAHDGSAYDLNQVDAQHVVNMYKRVFEEFYFI